MGSGSQQIIALMTSFWDRSCGERRRKSRYIWWGNRVHRGLGEGLCGCHFKPSQAVSDLYMLRAESVQSVIY